MQEALASIEKGSVKKKIADIRVGDTVRVHQRIKEGKKERVQIFEGLVIRYRKQKGVGAFITVRKIASGVGVEKSWFVHSPNVVKVQIIKRSRVRRALLSYMRGRSGKSARMADQEFDRSAANEADERTAEQIAQEEQAKIKKEIKAESADSSTDEENQVETSTEELAKKEDKKAAQEDPSSSDDAVAASAPEEEKNNKSGDDESQLPAEEVKKGLDKASK